MTWRLAKSLIKLRDQINLLVPERDKSNDGTIGDTRHQASKSDHNPNSKNVVQALDITHNPPRLDTYKLAEVLRKNRDNRIKYVISKGKIFSSKVSPWVWRKYSGTNPHDKHIHISVDDNPALYDDTSNWTIEASETMITSTEPSTDWYKDITATVFGGKADPNKSAYDEHDITDTELGVALPYKFTGQRPTVDVMYKNKLITNIPIIDVGPWNINDPYWWDNSRPKAESGRDAKGRKTNLAGIDLTPGLAKELSLPGKAKVDWRFTPVTADITISGKDKDISSSVVVQKPLPEIAIVEIKSKWLSKTIWVQLIGIASAILLFTTAGQLSIPEELQNLLATSIPVIIGFVTITIKTWFTNTVTPESLAPNTIIEVK